MLIKTIGQFLSVNLPIDLERAESEAKRFKTRSAFRSVAHSEVILINDFLYLHSVNCMLFHINVVV